MGARRRIVVAGFVVVLALGAASACRRDGRAVHAGRNGPDPLTPDPDWLFPVGEDEACGFIDARGTEVLPRTLRAACRGPGYSRSELIPAALEDGYGFVDSMGRVALAARYETVGRFAEGLAAVKRGGRWGFIDAGGHEVIAPRFAYVQPFSEGLAIYANRESGPFGYIDRTGSTVVPATYQVAYSFHGGLARINDQRGDAFIDRRGRIVLAAATLKGWHFPYRFSGGLAATSHTDVEAHGCRYLDERGRVALQIADCDFAYDFHEGLAAFSRYRDSSGELAFSHTEGYLDLRGRVAIQPSFEHAGEFAGGLAPVIVKEGAGHVDRRGDFSIPPRFRSTAPFAHGLAEVITKEGERAYIDRSGNLVWPRPRAPGVGRPLKYRELGTRGGSTAFDTRDLRVIKTPGEFAAVWKNAMRSLGRPVEPPPTEFTGNTYVLVALGTFPNTAWGLRLREVVENEGRIVIHFDELRPYALSEGCMVGQAIVSPFVLLEIESAPKPVVFEPRVLSSSGCR